MRGRFGLPTIGTKCGHIGGLGRQIDAESVDTNRHDLPVLIRRGLRFAEVECSLRPPWSCEVHDVLLLL